MFVVVAIVIFGIFIGLSYTLFGNTLKPAVVNLFEKATEQSSNDLNNWSDVTELDTSNLSWDRETQKGKQTVIFGPEYFKQDGVYKVNFDLTLDSGTIEYLGGHLHTTDASVVKVDGVAMTSPLNGQNSWRYGIPFDIEVGETKHVELTFTANHYDEPIAHTVKSLHLTVGRYMSSDGYSWLDPVSFKATMSNLVLREQK